MITYIAIGIAVYLFLLGLTLLFFRGASLMRGEE